MQAILCSKARSHTLSLLQCQGLIAFEPQPSCKQFCAQKLDHTLSLPQCQGLIAFELQPPCKRFCAQKLDHTLSLLQCQGLIAFEPQPSCKRFCAQKLDHTLSLSFSARQKIGWYTVSGMPCILSVGDIFQSTFKVLVGVL